MSPLSRAGRVSGALVEAHQEECAAAWRERAGPRSLSKISRLHGAHRRHVGLQSLPPPLRNTNLTIRRLYLSRHRSVAGFFPQSVIQFGKERHRPTRDEMFIEPKRNSGGAAPLGAKCSYCVPTGAPALMESEFHKHCAPAALTFCKPVKGGFDEAPHQV